MNRRRFLQFAGGSLATGTLAACLARRPDHDAAPVVTGELDASSFHASRRYAKLRSGEIAYVERGSGPAALFLHGFPLNSFQWRGALTRLSPYRRCIAADFMGMGYTRVAANQDVGPKAQVAMLIELLDHLGIHDVDVIANDSGCTVAQLLLVNHPQRVRTLLLTNGDTEHDSPPPALQPVIDLARQGRFVDEWLAPWWQDPQLARSAAGIGGMCFADPTQPTDEAIDTYFGPLLSSAHRKAMAHAYAVGLEPNVLLGIEAELKRSKTPTRIVWGMADTIFSQQSPDYWANTFGGSRGVRKLESSKLFWPEERPDVIAEEARRLWNAWAAQDADWR
ncbi:alpha/beta hydrolase [Lysobacter sp. Root690]|uniref:alpha/beta fold hydrolase n=1 Tax=Lysobacter sp. Root690 TaxID=1736588 RepID=UPI0006F6751B|nr:alpha/beta hydrolase [Lysobacter sp. Root690]KRB05081.1 alpha/beta hydrolase [Lysobacter sp. Root690]